MQELAQALNDGATPKRETLELAIAVLRDGLADDRALTDLVRQVGAARWEFEKGNLPTRERLKMVAEALGFSRAGTFPHTAVLDYADLVTRDGDWALGKYLEMGPGIPPVLYGLKGVSGCPLEPWAAIKELVEFHGWDNPKSCLRWLLRKRQEMEDRGEEGRVLDALAGLPYQRGDQPAP